MARDSLRLSSRLTSRTRWAVLAGAFMAGLILWITDRYFTAAFTEDEQIEARVTATLQSGDIISVLEKQSAVPLILSRDDVLIKNLLDRDFSQTSQRLISIQSELGAAQMILLDIEGRIVGATDRNIIATDASKQPYFNSALRTNGTIFSRTDESPKPGFYYARKIEYGNDVLGIIVVQVDLGRLEHRWRRSGEVVIVSDTEDRILLSSNPVYTGQFDNVGNFQAELSEPIPVSALIYQRFGSEALPFQDLRGKAFIREDVKIGFRGWKLSYFRSAQMVRDRVNGILMLEGMVFAILAALTFYQLSQASSRVSLRLQKESDELRELNARLSAEIQERQRAEKNLQVAEASLAQSSKLAALGQMSAAVSHELNQPLAAMRTYLAGAKLLIRRKRATEAVASFERVEDLVDRMGSITRQLKSFARKGSDDLEPIDLRDPIKSALSMMTPQLGTIKIAITRSMPEHPVMVLGDTVRLEQIIVNLIRNALDATKATPNPEMDILLLEGESVTLSIRDNGTGIDDPDALFEPFYTTKKPGEGVGLGLAISAGIASDLGGRLSAKNAEPQGAVFDLELPRLTSGELRAAE